jgi:hypothetical protein
MKYATTEKVKKILYVKFIKALYGTLRAARLFYEEMSRVLVQKGGFTINPYDQCVVRSKKVGGKQFKVNWHVDDLKTSHFSPAVVDEVIALLQKFSKKKILCRFQVGNTTIALE